MISSTMELAAPARFWNPIRERIVSNLVGTDLPRPTKPVVTYITRQTPNRRRKLSDSSHESLLSALGELQKEGVCEVQVVEENEGVKLVELVERSTVLVSVHGSGLTVSSLPRNPVLRRPDFARLYASINFGCRLPRSRRLSRFSTPMVRFIFLLL
jgi:hypothetical protein